MAGPQQVGPGLPGGFPLPNSAAPGTAYGLQQKAHPAAVAAGGMMGMAPGGRPPALGGKK